MKLDLIFLFILLRQINSQLLGESCYNCTQQKPVLVDFEDRIHYGVLKPQNIGTRTWTETDTNYDYDITTITPKPQNPTPTTPPIQPPIQPPTNPPIQPPVIPKEPQNKNQTTYYYITSKETIKPPKTNYYYISIDSNQKSVYLKTLENDITELKNMIQQTYNEKQKMYLIQLLDRINKLYELERSMQPNQTKLDQSDLLKIKLQISNFKNQIEQDYTQRLVKRYQDLLNYQQEWQDKITKQYENYQNNIQKQQKTIENIVREKEIIIQKVQTDNLQALEDQKIMYTKIIDKQNELINQLLEELQKNQNDQRQQNQILKDQTQNQQQLLTLHRQQNQFQRNNLNKLFRQFFEDSQSQIQRIENERLEIWERYITRIETEVLHDNNQQQQFIQQLQDQIRRLDIIIQRQYAILQSQNQNNFPDFSNEIEKYLNEQQQRINNQIEQIINNYSNNPYQGVLTKQELENLLQQQQILLQIYIRYLNPNPDPIEGGSGATSGSGSSTITISNPGRQVRMTEDLYRAQYGTTGLPQTSGANKQYTLLQP